ncbi:MAG: photosystem II reaction center protein Psb28 [Nostocales cyanobacterium]|nr:MAG: photosystem II reaction center protein Psb28 [Nostocales cyanobacterium]
MAKIQFSRGVDETVVPDVRLTRSRSGDQGTATFIFTNPDILAEGSSDEITGMYMIDEEGEIITREVKGKFVNGKPEALEATHLMKTPEEWDRFMRFMERYAEENGLGLSKS